MTPPKTKKLFISYRSTDAAKVDKIARDLALLPYEDGTPRYMTWQDKHNLPPASPHWWDAIVDAIIDCDMFVFNLSRASLQSEVCRAELHYAHKRNRPIIPVVLDNEFTLNVQSGKYDLPKDTWALVPDWLGERQFLFYVATEFYSKFQTAVEMFERNWPRDINAPRPLNPDSKSVHGSNHSVYAAARDYAYRLAFADAEKHFDTLVRRNDPLYADSSAHWLERIRLYGELIEMVEQNSPMFAFKKQWALYEALPMDYLEGETFDPKGFATRETLSPPAKTPSPPQINIVPPPHGQAQQNENIPPPAKAPSPSGEGVGGEVKMGQGGRAKETTQTRKTTAEFAAAIRAIIGDPFDLCDVPAGEFLYGENNETLTLPAFAMGKYPITYNQFQVFIDAKGGFHSPKWWEGLAQRNQKPGDQRWKIAAHPRERVDWYDAIAFCRWLSAQLGGGYAIDNVADWLVRLPTEYEWEKAARGTDGRVYPYGNEFDKTKGNTAESGFEKTTPVEQYPQGVSPYGVLDMSGNVWEWSWSAYADSKFNPLEQEISTNVRRVLRGGSFYNNRNNARADSRNYSVPYFRYDSFGLRIAAISI